MNLINEILRYRLEEPERIKVLAARRIRRSKWERDKLVIVAMDHPGRRVVAAGGNPWAMANRNDLLHRIISVLMQPGVDGLLATPDVMEEVLLLNHIVTEAGGPNFVDNKVLVGSMNRGGLANTEFELDDFVTGYTAKSIRYMNLDAGKLLFRLDPEIRDSHRTMKYCVDALNELEDYELPCFLEPLTSSGTADDLVRLVGVASAMGHSTAHRWIKLPMVQEMKRVAAATTCPIVLLGGMSPGKPGQMLENVRNALEAGINIRGLMIGRGVLYPEDGDSPVNVATKLVEVVKGKQQEVITWDGLKSIP
ncbi:Cgl0159 family (beta/alpha)8-fold protein [Alicyclobacillus dauci]|uniref:Cgl0159-like domain-containing protein n=1 Tax=Alicyclobacillus dauci TaxID=1475485 RepID=A0ABY6Z6P8_9BACL|nr:hypothetical protein [Alicyclobacillus dauci]WAH37956.1 hypothetical protein NZD86_05545 [Alicyclobacillus dauci]